jgi:hypothetical protein
MSTSKLVQIAIAAMSETKEARVERELNTTLKFMVTDCKKLISSIEGSLQTLNDELDAANALLEDEKKTLLVRTQTIPNVDRKEAYKTYRTRVEAQKQIVNRIERDVVYIKNSIIDKQKQLDEAKNDLAVLTEQA